MKYFKKSELKKSGIDLAKIKTESEDKLVALIAPFYPAEIIYKYSVQDGKNYYKHCTVVIEYEGLLMNVHGSNDNKYRLFCEDVHNLKNIDFGAKNRVQQGLNIPEPNRIGVFTKNKLTQWLEYNKAFYEACKKVNGNNAQSITDFYKSIEGLPVRYWNEKRQGEIVKNGIEFSFQVNENYVSTQIKLHYKAGSSIETFLKLSDNKFIAGE